MEEITGQIERITFTNSETGFTVAKVQVKGRRDLVTVVGRLPSPVPGQVLRLTGEWGEHPKFGRQFQAETCQVETPATVDGIRKYLGSGMIHGFGPVMAGRIVEAFGDRALEIIENQPERLLEVEGIGRKRVKMIRAAWDEQRHVRRVMLFLQDHGVGQAFASRIYKQYGDGAVERVLENPYRLARDVIGIGFSTADRIAGRLGTEKDDPRRADAGLLHVLNESSENGHVFLPRDELLDKGAALLGVDRAIVERALESLAGARRVIVEERDEPGEESSPAVYSPRLYLAETGVALRLKTLMAEPRSIRPFDADKAAAWVQNKLALRLADLQLEAVRRAAREKVLVITGGPGTGKTTIILAILAIFLRLPAGVQLAAPTGRAAKRMSEAANFEARTIHRLLEFNPVNGEFKRNAALPLDCDLLVVDEASMIDTVLMHHLLSALPAGAVLVLVGDVDQLPSVGPGTVLKDIIASGAAPVVRLNEIFRQAEQSRIVVNAHRINQGRMPLSADAERLEDFYFIERSEPEEALPVILELVTHRIPDRFGLSPLRDVQVLSPMHRGLVGAANLNLELQNALNPGPPDVIRGEREYRLGDKVMQVRNNYDKEVFNGDIGRISRVDAENQALIVDFDGRAIPYDLSDLDELVLAYAVTVHKSQGSEYPAVVLPVLTQHYVMLQRNLIYTAVTRGKRLVVLVGAKKALEIALANAEAEKRYAGLRRRLQG